MKLNKIEIDVSEELLTDVVKFKEFIYSFICLSCIGLMKIDPFVVYGSNDGLYCLSIDTAIDFDYIARVGKSFDAVLISFVVSGDVDGILSVTIYDKDGIRSTDICNIERDCFGIVRRIRF